MSLHPRLGAMRILEGICKGMFGKSYLNQVATLLKKKKEVLNEETLV